MLLFIWPVVRQSSDVQIYCRGRYYYQKFGKQRVESMVPAMTKNFADVGVKYSMGGLTGSTIDSHRLATWTKDKHGLEKQNEVMTNMFQAYFSVRGARQPESVLAVEIFYSHELPVSALPQSCSRCLQDEKYLGDRDVLVEAANAAGLSADDARKMLEDDQAYLAEVQAELSMAQQLQVSGVPFFVFHPPTGVQGRPLGVSGAQPTETIVDILSSDLGLDEEHSPAASG